MPRIAGFPRSEAEILALAQELVIGLSNNVASYSSPPISVMEMATTINAYASAKYASTAAQATEVITEITLVDQERGKEWEYRIVAINRSGEGEPGIIVMAVLYA